MTEIVPVPLSNSLERQGEDGLRGAIMRSDSSRAELAEAGDYPQLLKGLLYLKDIKADLDTLIRATEDDITRLMPEKKMFIEEVGTVERRTSSTRKWESEDLLKHITRSTLDPEGTGEVSINNVVMLIDTLKDIKADLDTLIRATEDDITRLMPEKKMFVEEVGTVERRMSSTRKWESEDLLKHITRSTLDPEGTGEVSINNVVMLIDTLKAVLPFTASLGWRVTALKELGIDVSEYSEATHGRQTVQITK